MLAAVHSLSPVATIETIAETTIEKTMATVMEKCCRQR